MSAVDASRGRILDVRARGVDSLTEQLGLGETSYITTDALPALAPFENAILDRRVTFGLKVPNRNAI